MGLRHRCPQRCSINSSAPPCCGCAPRPRPFASCRSADAPWPRTQRAAMRASGTATAPSPYRAPPRTTSFDAPICAAWRSHRTRRPPLDCTRPRPRRRLFLVPRRRRRPLRSRRRRGEPCTRRYPPRRRSSAFLRCWRPRPSRAAVAAVVDSSPFLPRLPRFSSTRANAPAPCSSIHRLVLRPLPLLPPLYQISRCFWATPRRPASRRPATRPHSCSARWRCAWPAFCVRGPARRSTTNATSTRWRRA